MNVHPKLEGRMERIAVLAFCLLALVSGQAFAEGWTSKTPPNPRFSSAKFVDQRKKAPTPTPGPKKKKKEAAPQIAP